MTDMLPQGTRIDLNNCDREPIHIPGGIQPIGFLIAASADWIVQRAANTQAMLDIAAEELLGQPLAGVFSPKAMETIRSRVSLLRSGDAVERIFELKLAEGLPYFDVALHFSGNTVIIEGEPATGDQLEVSSLVRGALSRLSSREDIASLLKEGARQFRSLIGYDRVMIYRFAPDGSGEVTAESVGNRADSFLGLNFPATDIPQQARALYVRNTFRLIGDVDCQPVPIEPIGEAPPLDLSLSLFRAVSPIHMEYLRNMGVSASLSVSIVVEGRLWGLIACHHYSPRVPSFAQRSAAELFGQIFSLQVESKVRQAISDNDHRAREVSTRLMTAAAQQKGKLLDAEWLCEMLPEAIPCDGVGVHIDGATSCSGHALNEADFRTLLASLNRRDAQVIHHTDRLASYVPALADKTLSVAGMLAIPISRKPRDYLVLFREEKIRSVRWAGDQEKSIEYGEHGPRLTPRKSFEEWSELVRGSAKPFTDAEVRTAEALRATMLEVVLHLSEQANDERERAHEQQKLLIAELNHRVRNILALIRALMSQTRREEASVEDMIGSLDARIKALANAHDLLTAENWVPAKLRDLLHTEFGAFLSESRDRVRLSGPPVSIVPQAVPIMALVFHEMATNAAKYGALSDSGTVCIDWSVGDNGDLRIDWREKGGPAVQAPSRKGFGSTITNDSIPHELGGEAKIAFNPAGVEASFIIPRKHVKVSADSAGEASSAADAGPSSVDLSGKNVLLVEDNMIIAMDAEDKLDALGAAKVRLAASTRMALELIGQESFDLAMLDFNLGEETSTPIADRLAELGVPFFFASGYGDREAIPAEYADRPLIVKPYEDSQIAAAIARVLA